MSLSGLTALQSIHCFGCPVTKLPAALVRLPRLEKPVVNPSPGLGRIPPLVLSRDLNDNCLPSLRAHFDELAAGAEPLRDVGAVNPPTA